MTVEITITSLLFFLLMLIPIMFFDKWYNFGFSNQLTVSVGRMFIQLLAVGLYLQYIFKINNVIINILYTLVMIFIASVSVINSNNLVLKKFIIPIFFSILIPQFLILMFFNYFVIKLENLFEAKYMITVGGMLLGNCLSGNIISLNTFYHGLKEDEATYLYTIALGATKKEAIKSYLVKSVNASVVPTIAGMATMGLVFLPGMMTGQILGGALPISAIKYQVAIIIAIFVAKFYSVLLSIYFTSITAFDEYDVLKKDLFK